MRVKVWTCAITLVLASIPTAVFGQQATKTLKSGIDLEQISKEIKPGDDFFDHVNSKWIEATEIPGDKSDYGAFTKLDDLTQEQIRAIIEEAAKSSAQPGSPMQQVGDLYRSFTDVETRNKLGIKPIEPVLAEVRKLDDKKALAPLMAKLSKQGVDLLFGYYVEPDAKNSEAYIVYMGQGGTTLPDRDYYLSDDKQYVETREKYVAYVEALLTKVGQPNAKEAAARIVELETKMAKAQWTKVENRDPIKTYNKMTSEELSKTLSNLPWSTFAEEAGVAKEPAFVIGQPSFFTAANELLAEVPLDTWKEYIVYQVADSAAPLLTEELEQLHFGFHETTISGVAEQMPMWKRGVETCNGLLGMVVGKLYVEKHFSPKAKARMQELVENLKKAFAQRIDQLEWMGKGTQVAAHEKLSQFTTKIGYPDKWKDYSSVKIDSQDLVGNLRRVAAFEYEYNLKKLGGPIDRTEWMMSPQTVNAYYNPLQNEIVFPAAILQPPFFDLEADDAVNYGGIGAVIGHEISHGFDDQGRRFDGKGNLRNWWTEEDRVEFEKRSQKLVELYTTFKPFADMGVNGELTLGENIGDLGGLSVAYTAYKLSLKGEKAPVIDGLTGDQRFFYGWGQVWRRKYREQELRRRLVVDPHSPSKYRVVGIVSNMDAFYEAFGIKEGDKMYIAPKDRVRIW